MAVKHRISYPWSIVAYCGALRENPAEQFTNRRSLVTCPGCKAKMAETRAAAKARLAEIEAKL